MNENPKDILSDKGAFDIYLIRHTTPDVAKGICYGQTDLDVVESFPEEATVIRGYLPADITAVHSSPLKRCALLAAELFPGQKVLLRDELKEIHCGEWEMAEWDALPPALLEPWMKDFVNIRMPGGESYLDVYSRVSACFEEIRVKADGPVAIVAHGGVIRSLLSYITNTPLIDSFKVFSLHYGCLIRLFEKEGGLGHEFLSNIPSSLKEQHKPKSFY